MTQLFRIIVAYTCLVFVIVFVALWVASYFWMISVSCRLNSDERLAMNSERGQLNWSWHRRMPGEVTSLLHWHAMALEYVDGRRYGLHSRAGRVRVWPPEPSLIGFACRRDGRAFQVVTPYWFPVLLIGAIGFIAKPRPKLKLGIRDLLIITTILAVLLTIGLRASQGPQELFMPPGARLRTVSW